MLASARRAPQQTLKFLFFAFIAGAAGAGCSGKLTPEQELDAAFKANPEFKRVQVAKYSGQVTVDGQVPDKNSRLFVVLFDADKYKDSKTAIREASVGPDGHFSFTTYLKDDGAPIGKHIVCFVDPRSGVAAGERNRKRSLGRPSVPLVAGADALKNLYNDPEVNGKDPQFQIDLQAPGVTDANFNLLVAGKDAPRTPGQYAITKLVTEGK
jgi:hypothetical protein